MKQYTPAIVNEIKKKGFFSLSRKYESRYYEGIHKEDESVRALWIETNSLGNVMCYPCALWEQDGLMAFRTGMRQQNKEMLQRWGQVIGPDKKDAFTIREMEEEEFTPLYQKAKDKRDEQEGLIMTAEDEWTDEELLADESLIDDEDEEEE